MKLEYYAGTTLALIGDHPRAERAALKAISMYESGPREQRPYGDEASRELALRRHGSRR
ncbi:hypothetical protein K1T35_48030 (plasmid) [Pseudonocardia sp. DSM 110487]|uniref:hypothetical protein n=1 Tax=Pseudonocardia sp. DSM 110487 TaxID=2865833 RepID=UPI001C699BFA|nr:hypothetical protein [Pseudonocardia sp. DSM 110487]QYN41100.1 hypothetical protein K1T35_48030 [Pseudonocardia sp. DSM 110487]